MVTRRRIVLGGTAVGVATVAGGAFALRLAAPAAGARSRSAAERETVRAIGEVLFPAGVFPIDGAHPAVVAEVDRIVGDMLDSLRARGFRYVLRTLEFATVASRGARFSRLDIDHRRQVLSAWADPGVLVRRVSWDSIRVILGMAFFVQPEVADAMEWRALCVGGAS